MLWLYHARSVVTCLKIFLRVIWFFLLLKCELVVQDRIHLDLLRHLLIVCNLFVVQFMQLLLSLRIALMLQGKALRFFRWLFLSFIFSWLRLVLPTHLVELLHDIALCHLFDILDLG